MKPPPPVVSKKSKEYIAWRFAVWQKENRQYLNEYNRTHYRKNILRERERHRLHYHGYSKKGTKSLAPDKIVDKLEDDRKYREEMRLKGYDNF